jgi:hypothetical protein
MVPLALEGESFRGERHLSFDQMILSILVFYHVAHFFCAFLRFERILHLLDPLLVDEALKRLLELVLMIYHSQSKAVRVLIFHEAILQLDGLRYVFCRL